ncbi:unnamed protein product [Ectocarpus sp. 4 AP-2014]
MEHKPDKPAEHSAANAKVGSADTETDTDVHEATQRAGALTLDGEGKGTASKATSAGTEATNPGPRAACSAMASGVAAVSGGAAGGGGGASTVDEQAAGAEPCENTQHDDRAVLQMLYETCGGAFWRMKIAWGTAAPIMSWFGIGTSSSSEGCISKLSLPWNKLAGRIPSEMGTLSTLEELVLHDNMLTGAIPIELSKLSMLRVLLLHNNSLAGYIPPDIGALSSLQVVHLQNNQLTGACVIVCCFRLVGSVPHRGPDKPCRGPEEHGLVPGTS